MATCLEVLNILISNINTITSSVAMNQCEAPLMPTDRTDNFESYFFIFHLTEKLLNRCIALQKIDNSLNVNRNTGCKEIKVTELWRRAWEKKDETEAHQNVLREQCSDISKHLQSWCADLKNAAEVFIIAYPLLTIYANKCLTLITDYQQN